jgi:hypothetical protein
MFQYVYHKRLELVFSSLFSLPFPLLNPASSFHLSSSPSSLFPFSFLSCFSTLPEGYSVHELRTLLILITRYATTGPMDRLVLEYG